MKFTLLTPNDYRSVPWKNGRGVTHEIIREPQEEGPPFHWLISMTEIKESGPFPNLPEYRRIISTLEGRGMRLTVDGRESETLLKYQPFIFEGESLVESELLDGPVSDFNLIYRRDLCRVRFQWLKVGEQQTVCTQSARLVLFSVNELRVLANEESFSLGHNHALLVENPKREMVKLSLGGTQAEPAAFGGLIELDILLQNLKWLPED